MFEDFRNQDTEAASQLKDSANILLLIEVPRTNDKKELSAEQMFAALHGIFKPKQSFFGDHKQEHISFEIVAIKKNIYFCIWMPKHLQSFVESQVYAQYSTAQIFNLEDDYSQRELHQKVIHNVELGLTTHETIPIKTFPNFEVDPLSGITATLARLNETDEEIWIQILARPIADDWHKKGKKHIDKIKGGSLASALLRAPFQPLGDQEDGKQGLSERARSQIDAIENKNTKLGYQVKIRLVYLGSSRETALLRMQALVGAFKQFNTTELNGFQQQSADFDTKSLQQYRNRDFKDSGFILNIEELASVFHLPHTSVDTPNIVWASAKTAEPPSILPTDQNYQSTELSCFGKTNFRSSNLTFGSLRSDRGRHVYVIGQTGTGKSGLLELLSLSDMQHNHGYAIVDPHGDFAINNLQMIPQEKIKDVVYFNPADADFPIGFNPLEVSDSRQKVNIASDLVGVMKRMFDSWGPRLEYILRYTILALLDNPGSTMLDITRMLTDKTFRKKIIHNVEDLVVVNFWKTEFNTWDNRFQTEAVAPVLNKVGAFTANPTIRNIIGQPKSSFDLRKIMDEQKIVILNLSRGLIGEDNANILGAMIITKIQLAAMSRADILNIEDRKPFYLYVDEFQNFATDSFAVILSEARKYGLFLTLANQYIDQMPPEVKSAVFGNVGTIVSFRVSPDDAPFLEKYFEPQFDSTDLIQLANRNFVTTMTIKGEKAPAFSGQTLDLPTERQDNLQQIIESSRRLYAKPRDQVEAEIKKATNQAVNAHHSGTNTHNNGLKRLREAEKAPATETSSPEPAPTPPIPSVTTKPTDEQPKKKRRRRRRKSNSTSEKMPPTP